MAPLKILLGILLGSIIGFYLPGLLPAPPNQEANIQPETAMIFLLFAGALAMAVGYAICFVAKSEGEMLKLIGRYANLWVVALVAPVTAFTIAQITDPEFEPFSAFVLQKYQLGLIIASVMMSMLMCLIQSKQRNKVE